MPFIFILSTIIFNNFKPILGAITHNAIYATLNALNPGLLNRVSSEINVLRAALQSNRPMLENIVNQAERSLRERKGA
jgi:hypothetical protein